MRYQRFLIGCQLLLTTCCLTGIPFDSYAHNKVVVIPLGDSPPKSQPTNCQNNLVAVIAIIDVRRVGPDFGPTGVSDQSCGDLTVFARRQGISRLQIFVDDGKNSEIRGAQFIAFGVATAGNDRLFSTSSSVKGCVSGNSDILCMSFDFQTADDFEFPNDTVHFVAYGKPTLD